MNGTTAVSRGPRLALILVAVAVIGLLAATFRVRTQASFVTASGTAGSAAYRQEIAFVRCMRARGDPGIPDPPPGNFAITVQLPPGGPGGPGATVGRAFDACRALDPSGRKMTNIQVRL